MVGRMLVGYSDEVREAADLLLHLAHLLAQSALTSLHACSYSCAQTRLTFYLPPS